MIEAVISFFGLIFGFLNAIFVAAVSSLGTAAVAAWTFASAWYPEIVLGLGIAYMIYLVVRHGKRGASHRRFEWAKIISEIGHLLRHPSPVGVLLVLISILAVVFGGHGPPPPGGGAPPSSPTHQV